MSRPSARTQIPLAPPSYERGNEQQLRSAVDQRIRRIETELDGFLQSGTDAVGRSMRSKLQDILTPLDFGAVGDGSTDDTAAFGAAAAAANAADKVLDGAGLTYRITGSGLKSTAFPRRLRNTVFDISDVTSPISSSDTTNGRTAGLSLDAGDMWGTSYSKATTSGTINKGSATVTVDSTSGFSAGDIVLLHANEVWSNGGTTKKSEAHVIKRVVDSTTLIFEAEIEGIYNTGVTIATIRKYPAIDIDWDTVRIIGAAPTLATVTMTIASPCVVTWTSHGLSAGQVVEFTTSGALPTGITAGTGYYVLATDMTANTFKISASLGGSAVNTSGAQSGTHTAKAYWPQEGVALFHARRVRMHNIVTEFCTHSGFLISNCYELTGGLLEFSNSNRNGFGYGLNCVGTNTVALGVVRGTSCRHVVATGGGASVNSSASPIQRRVSIGVLVGYGCTDGVFDAHPGVKTCQLGQVAMTGAQSYQSSGDGILWQGSHLQVGCASLYGFLRHGLVYEPFQDGDQDEISLSVGSLIARSDKANSNNYGLIVTTGNVTDTVVRSIVVGHIDVDTDTGVLITTPVSNIKRVAINGGYIKSAVTHGIRFLCSASARIIFANLNNVTAEAPAQASTYAVLFTGVSGSQISMARMVGCDTIGGAYGAVIEEGTLDLISHTNSGATTGATATGTAGVINTYA